MFVPLKFWAVEATTRRAKTKAIIFKRERSQITTELLVAFLQFITGYCPSGVFRQIELNSLKYR